MTEFTYDKKRSLAKKISGITEKKFLIDIINIIRTLNPNIPMTNNDNGVFITFNNLVPQTYANIENYLKKNIPKKQDDQQLVMSYTPYVSDDCDLNESSIKLSNKERALIKKQRYSEQCND